jgi:hypothetical protein
MKVVMYGYLYVREKRWGFKVDTRVMLFHKPTADMLNGKPFKIYGKSRDYEIKSKTLDFAEFAGKLYGNFDMDTNFKKKDLIMVEVDIG